MSDIVHRINAVMLDVGAISKDRENTHFKYWYVSAEAVRAAVQKACAKHGLVLRLTFSDESVTPAESVMKCAAAVSMDGTTFVHLGDGWGAGTDRGDKSPMKACTAASKYAIANAFCIALGEDPEADEATDKAASIGAPLKTYAYSDEEQARAVEQGIVALGLANGFVSDFETLTHVDDAMRWLDANMGPVDALGEKMRKHVATQCAKHAASGAVEGMSAIGFKEAWTAARDASRRAAKEGG